MIRSLGAVFFIVIALVALAPADSLPDVRAAVVAGEAGQLTLEVSGSVRGRVAWLEVSLHHPGDGVGDQAFIYSVSGDFRVPVPLAAGSAGGTYDVALWSRRLSEPASCRPAWLKAYAAGSVTGGPARLDLADSLALLQTSVVTLDGRKVLKVSGTARDDRWLVVIFGSGIDDSDDDEVVLHISKGDFVQKVAVPTGRERGGYTAALWVRMSQSSGYSRFDGELARTTGKSVPE
jgi:hypothetical protein